VIAIRTTRVERWHAASGAVASAAKQEQQTAYAALPRIHSKMNQNALLQKTVSVDAHGRVVVAFGAAHFFFM
jgi:hypothetical protein